MRIVSVELTSQSLWGLFTEEEKPRIIISTLLTKEGQVTEIDEDDLTPNQLQVLESSHVMGLVKVKGASFLEANIAQPTCEIFEEEEEEEETDFQKMMKEKMDRLEQSRKKQQPAVDEKEVASFLKKRQDKLVVGIKKGQKPLSFLKACLSKESDRKKPRKKVLSVLKEAIEYKLASVKEDVGGIDTGKMSDMKNLARGSSYLESQYSDMIEEEELEKPEEQKKLSKEELLALLEDLEKEG